MINHNRTITTEIAATGSESPLSPHYAFVVQFRTRTEEDQDLFTGRVEHVTSGQATRFSSLEELADFLGRTLTDVTDKPP